MKYCSTRGVQKDLSFKDVLFSGYASDGGLYMPEVIPKLSQEVIKAWYSLTYPELVYNIARLFIDQTEISDQDLKNVVSSAFNKFRDDEIIKVVDVSKVSNKSATSPTVASGEKVQTPLLILELFHGPTYAFKDLAMSFVAALMEYYLTKEKRHVTILVGTSGDTGGSAIAAMEGRPNIDLIVLLPRGRCSLPQLLHMVTSQHNNITVYSVEGTSDDLDVPIKECFSSPEFVQKHNLMSINSINWGRILGQVAHYFYAYYRVVGKTVGQTLEFVVPTGAAGNITSGCVARSMGLPVTFTAAVNTNDILARTVNDGDFSKKGSVVPCMASAMDIQVPYNIERLFFLSSGRNTSQVKALMDVFERDGAVTVPRDVMAALRTAVSGAVVYGDSTVMSVMSAVYEAHEYLLCPHTATAVAHHYHSPQLRPRVFVSTASPAKFPEALRTCLGGPEGLRVASEASRDLTEALEDKPHTDLKMNAGDDWTQMLKDKIIEVTEARVN